MTNPTTAAEWGNACTHGSPTRPHDGNLCPDCANAYARQQVEAATADLRNPHPCSEHEGADCPHCDGSGFRCVDCPTYSRAADMWQALLAQERGKVEAFREPINILKDVIDLAAEMAVEDRGDGNPLGDNFDAWARLDNAEKALAAALRTLT